MTLYSHVSSNTAYMSECKVSYSFPYKAIKTNVFNAIPRLFLAFSPGYIPYPTLIHLKLEC